MSASDEPGEPVHPAWRTDEAWARLRTRMDAADRARAKRRRVAGVAAGAVAATALAAGVALLLARPRNRTAPPVTHTVATTAGERRTVELGDGTVVELAPASSLRWTEGRDARIVALEGLANFRVVHDAARPFVVRARDARVTDVGTEFVVRAYATDSATRVSVLSGVVGLARAARPGDATTSIAPAVTLHAGEVGIVGAADVVRLSSSARVADDSAWLHGALSFDDVRLDAVATELGRWFGITILVDDAALARRRVTAIYAHPELAPVVDAIAASVGATVVREGRVYHIRIRGR